MFRYLNIYKQHAHTHIYIQYIYTIYDSNRQRHAQIGRVKVKIFKHDFFINSRTYFLISFLYMHASI